MRQAQTGDGLTAAAQITRKFSQPGDWRGQTLGRLRRLIQEAVPDVVEELKWMGTPVWSHGGILCTGETYKAHVKLTFLHGAALADPAGLFNASLDGNARRAIDLHEGDEVDAKAFKALIRAAAAFNAAKAVRKTGTAARKAAAPRARKPAAP